MITGTFTSTTFIWYDQQTWRKGSITFQTRARSTLDWNKRYLVTRGKNSSGLVDGDEITTTALYLFFDHAERTEKIPLGSIKKVLTEPIKGHEEYHMLVSSLYREVLIITFLFSREELWCPD